MRTLIFVTLFLALISCNRTVSSDDGSSLACSNGSAVNPRVGEIWCDDTKNPYLGDINKRRIVSVKNGYFQYESIDPFVAPAYWIFGPHSAPLARLCSDMGKINDNGDCVALPVPQVEAKTPEEKPRPQNVFDVCTEDRAADVRVGQVYEYLPPDNPFEKRPFTHKKIVAVNGKYHSGVAFPGNITFADDNLAICRQKFFGIIRLKTEEKK